MLKVSALGFDTSNYTTSAAFFADGVMNSCGKLLPVKPGEIGLRQSDAVFHHTKQLPEVFAQLGDVSSAKAIGVSTRPRDAEDSYMPCFLVGTGAAQMLAQSMNIPLYRFSHQQGHIAAALYSAGRLDLLAQRFIAFHLSGGTTEAVLVEPDKDKMFTTALVASSLDLKAGQVIDRIGVMLGLQFPAGKHLDPLACAYNGSIKVKASMKGANCSLSGVENKCRSLFEKGAESSEVAATCMAYVIGSIDAMCKALLDEHGKELPVLFSGGVSSNSMLRERMTKKYGAVFAEPRYSADNAAGAAVLASLCREGL